MFIRNLRRIIKVLSVRASNKYLLKYFITYCTVLIIPLVIGYVYYINTYKIVYSDSINENNTILRQASSILEQRFEEADSMADQIISNSYVSAFQGIKNPLQYPNSYSIIRTRDSLTNYNTSNKFVWNYFIFFNKSEMVMNNEITYTYEQFYERYMGFKGIPYEEWYGELTEKLSEGGLSGEIEAELYNYSPSGIVNMTMVTYSKPLISYGQNDGIVMLVIDKKEITDLLSSINTYDGGVTYIENKAGEIITYFSGEKCDIQAVQAAVNQSLSESESSKEVTINGKKMMVNYIKTENGFKYVAVQSKKVVLEKANNLKFIIYIVLLISVLLGTIISYIMAKRSAKPLQDILNNMQISEISEDIFKNIKYTISELGDNNSNLKRTIDEQIPILKTTFLTRLINGEFNSQEEVEKVARCISLNYKGSVYCIVIFKFDTDLNNYDTLELSIVSSFKQLLRDILGKVVPDALISDLDEQQLVMLVDYPSFQQEKLNPYIENVAARLKQEMPKNLFESLLISCGNIVDQLIDIPVSFEKAKLAFKINSANKHSNILWYAGTGNYTVNYYFPTDLQAKLINNVKAGDKGSVKSILNTLFTKNIMDSNLSTSLQKLFVYELLGIIIKLWNQIGFDEKTYNYIISNTDNIDKYSELKQIKIITDSYYMLCEIMNGQSDKQSLNTNNQIVDYINDYYHDCNISLASIADKFNMNESYLSYIFKHQSGIKLSSYIENLRIEKAKELLGSTALSISEIALKTGYLSTNTFCRAFKRVTGINATTFRGSNL